MVTSIAVSAPEPNEPSISFLRQLLAKAEAGELLGFVACCELTGGEVLTVDAGDFAPFAMVGHLEFAKARVMSRRMELAPDEEGESSL
jgi:hypothetical protein